MSPFEFRPLEAALVLRIIILLRMKILGRIPQAFHTAVNRGCTIRSMIRKHRLEFTKNCFHVEQRPSYKKIFSFLCHTSFSWLFDLSKMSFLKLRLKFSFFIFYLRNLTDSEANIIYVYCQIFKKFLTLLELNIYVPIIFY